VQVSHIAQTPLHIGRSLHLLAVVIWEVAMDRFVHKENMAHYKKLIAESERNPKRDEDRHKMLLTLLAEEIAKEKPVG
jgi:hypothetical protein